MRSRSKLATLVLALLGATALGKMGDVLRARPPVAADVSAPAAPVAPVAPAAAPPATTAAGDAGAASTDAGTAPSEANAGRSHARAARAAERGSEPRDGRMASEGGSTTTRRPPPARMRPRVQPMPTLVIGAPAPRTSEW